MATIYQTNKKTGITYIIESESYWDKEKQQPRSHRTIIGKLDPVTGEVVPTKKYNREKKPSSSGALGTSEQAASAISMEHDELVGHIRKLEQRVIQLQEEKEALIRDLNKVLQQHSR